MNQVGIVGAGITGITTAYYLAKAGYQVTVYDRHSYAAMQTSYANGGQLSVSNSEVWTTPSTVWKGLKWMFQKDAPLLFNPLPSVAKYRWIAGFLGHTLMNTSASRTRQTIEMGLAARELYFQIAEEEGLDFDLEKRGILHFYRNGRYLESAKKSCQMFQSLGVDRHMVDPQELFTIEPTLTNCQHDILGGTYTPGDASGDIHHFCMKLAKILATKYGVEFWYDTEVLAMEQASDIILLQTRGREGHIRHHSQDKVVICGGVDSAKLSTWADESLNIYPVKGYSITVMLDDQSAAKTPMVSLLDEETKIVSSRLGNRFRVAGTAELAGWNYDIRADRIRPLTNWVRECFPGVSLEDVKPWAGLRPMTSSMMPIVRPSKASPAIMLNTGHGHLGWTLSPATAVQTLEYFQGLKS